MKGTPLVLGRGVQPDPTIMQLDDVVNDEQSQAAAANTFTGMPDPVKHLENLLAHGRWDSVAGIAKDEMNHAGVTFHLNPDACRAFAVKDGVFNQITQYCFHGVDIKTRH